MSEEEYQAAIEKKGVHSFVMILSTQPAISAIHQDLWLRLVITHEYAHVLQMDMASRLPLFTRRVFGRPQDGLPGDHDHLMLAQGGCDGVGALGDGQMRGDLQPHPLARTAHIARVGQRQ